MTEGHQTWISVSQAAKRVDTPRWKMRRMLHRLNRLADGRLLRHTSQTASVRKWWVSAPVLEELLVAKRLERTGATMHQEVDDLTDEMDAVQERLTVLESRTEAQTKRLGAHGAHLKRHDRQLVSQRKVLEGLAKSAGGLDEAVRELAKAEIRVPSDGH